MDHIPTDIAILGRLLKRDSRAVRPTLTRHILFLGFHEKERERMNYLAARNREGRLSDAERGELFAFVRAGHLLAALQSRARKTLAKRT